MKLKEIIKLNESGDTILHYDGYEINIWEERDNLVITLYDNNEKEIRSWSDDDAHQMFEDGFFNRKNLRKSIVDYAKEVKLIK